MKGWVLLMGEKKVYFDVTFSGDDVLKIIEALKMRCKGAQDAPVKMVGLALTVAELEALRMRDVMSKAGVLNVDEIIEGIRSQARERASYLNKM